MDVGVGERGGSYRILRCAEETNFTPELKMRRWDVVHQLWLISIAMMNLSPVEGDITPFVMISGTYHCPGFNRVTQIGEDT